jgi:hypothetical protein
MLCYGYQNVIKNKDETTERNLIKLCVNQTGIFSADQDQSSEKMRLSKDGLIAIFIDLE